MYYLVENLFDKEDKHYASLRSCDGRTATIESRILPIICYSADNFNQTITVSMSQMPIILEKAKDSIFTVEYMTMPSIEELSQRLAQINVC